MLKVLFLSKIYSACHLDVNGIKPGSNSIMTDKHTADHSKTVFFLIYKFKKIIGNPNFSNLLKRLVNRFERAGYSLEIMQQTACLVFNPIMVEGYAALFSCTALVQASDSMTASM